MEIELYKRGARGKLRSYVISIMFLKSKNAIVKYSESALSKYPSYTPVKVTKFGIIGEKIQTTTSEINIPKSIKYKILMSASKKESANILDLYLKSVFNSEIHKKIKRNGFFKNIEEASIAESISPMKLSVYKHGKIAPDQFKHYYIQPKIDGERCIARYNSNLNKFDFISRQGDLFVGLDHISDELCKMRGNKPSETLKTSVDYIDGELYIPNFDLQKITSIVNTRTKLSSEDMRKKKKVKYIVFDLVNLDWRDEPFISRWKRLVSFFKYGKRSSVKLIKIYYPVKDESALNKLHEKIVKEGYEGVVLRRDMGIYKFGKRGLLDIMKKKFRLESDYKVVGFTGESRGKYKNAIIWICETKNKSGKIKLFKVVPEGVSKLDRIKAYNEVSKNFDQYKGRLLQVNYYDMTSDNIPKFANSSLYPKLR